MMASTWDVLGRDLLESSLVLSPCLWRGLSPAMTPPGAPCSAH